jgi:plastocyanin
VALALLPALAVALTACGDDDDGTASDAGTTPTSADAGGTDYGGASTGGDAPASEGTIVAEGFALTDLTVAPGEAIVLENRDGTQHTATGDDGEFDLEADGGTTSEPGTAPVEPGTYTFHCEIHPSMTATLTVEG